MSVPAAGLMLALLLQKQKHCCSAERPEVGLLPRNGGILTIGPLRLPEKNPACRGSNPGPPLFVFTHPSKQAQAAFAKRIHLKVA